MANPYLVRSATEADVRALVAIERQVFSDPWSAAAFRSLLGSLSLVAVTDDRVAGYVFGRPLVDEGEILNLAVHPDHRGKGIGRSLLEASLRYLGEGGARSVYLEVRASNARAQDFYWRMGFREVGRRRGYYDKPREDALVLAREIGADQGLR